MKTITFSFDDGIKEDKRLVEILNKYGLKSTFNLNSALMTNRNIWNYDNKKTVVHMNYTECAELYNGHEIACHGYTHPYFSKLDYETTYNDIFTDKKILEFLFDCKIEGMAYPFGDYDEKTLDILKELGFRYSRGVNSTYIFDVPINPLVLEPTCHYRDKKIKQIAKEFLELKTEKPSLFYIWGHSYELVTEEDWQDFDEFCKFVSNKTDINYLTNIEAINWIESF